MGKAKELFEELQTLDAPPAPEPAATAVDDSRDLRALPDGRIVPLDWTESKPQPEIDRGSPATWD